MSWTRRRLLEFVCVASLVLLPACNAGLRSRATSARAYSSPSQRDAKGDQPQGRIFDNLRSRAEHDLACSARALKIRELGDNAWGVVGCNQRATYMLVRDGYARRWVLNSISGKAPAQARTPFEESRGTAVTVTRGKEQRAVLSLSLPAPKVRLTIKLKAEPVAHPGVALLGLERPSSQETMKACELKVVANGERVPLPAGTYQGVKQALERVVFEMPITSLATVAQADRVVAQVCQDRIELSSSELGLIREFLVRFREEQELAGTVAPSETPVPDNTSL